MDLNNDFDVAVGIEEAWIVLNDVERIAPCLPGAQLTEIEGDEFRGNVKVKVGPITAQYKGKAHFVEQNHAEKRVVINGEGRDIRGAGNANALITATLEEQGPNATKVRVNTDLKVTGKVAQFGRGVMADISGKLMGQFAENLEQMLAESPAPAAGAATGVTAKSIVDDAMPVRDRITPTDLAGAMADAASSVTRTPAAEVAAVTAASSSTASSSTESSPTESSGVRKIDSPEVEAVDLLDAAGAPITKRLIPVAAGLVGAFLLRTFLRRRRG